VHERAPELAKRRGRMALVMGSVVLVDVKMLDVLALGFVRHV
jgi:hypothetical protein